jgi:cellobiose phosphorylase
MRYGGFSEDGREFIIHDPATPTPWINYLYNGHYFATVSNNGGGISYVNNPLHGRITRYRINDVPSDRPGKYVYVRDRETGARWSLFWQPMGGETAGYRTCHGFGYTRSEAAREDIESKLLLFVAPEDDAEVWKCTISNTSEKPRRLSLYAYAELCLGHAQIDLINQCDDQHFNRVHFDEALNALLATKTYWVTRHAGTQQQENQAWDQWVFFTASERVSQYETLRERFIGPFRNEGNPEALEKGELSCRGTDHGNAVAVLRVEVELAPGETREVVFSLGVIPKAAFDAQKARDTARFQDCEAVDRAFAAMKRKWDRYFEHTMVTTPDREVDVFLNYWIPYQARVAFDVGRVASYYYWGIGRGFGFRDTAQDTLAIVQTDPEKARERILLLSRQMFATGRVFHHFTADGQGETTGHCDDPFWLILAATEYIKETGDLDVLEEKEPFLEGGEGTVLDHLLAAARLAGGDLGRHGLPAFGRGDWNDTLDYIGGDEGGESVWGAMFYAAMLDALIELLVFKGRDDGLAELRAMRDALKERINAHAWDGAWFIRAFGAGDRRIGSASCRAGRIFLNPQSWAVIGKVADRDRLVECMDSVKRHLDTELGPKICAPAFQEIDPSIGLITRCVAGKKENGAVFCHPVTWAIMAECMLGRGNQAYRYFRKTLPGSVDQDTFKAEPYVYSQYITSDEHAEPGRASHSWQTGTAAWMKKATLDHLLGVRADYAGLVIDPVIPSLWPRFEMKRTFRGTRYHIVVENPQGVESGVLSIEADGKPVEGNRLPLTRGMQCSVRVLMGRKE